MRELAFVAALVLMIGGGVFFWRLTSGTVLPAHNTSTPEFLSAVNAARGVSAVVGMEQRRRWAVNVLELSSEEIAAMYSLKDLSFGVDGVGSEVLVLSAVPVSSSVCTSFANGTHGLEASKQGFTQLTCRENSTGEVFEVPLSR